MSNSPVISVVMPVYNNEKYLDTAIKSVLNQTYSNFEFIIIDDGSTDSSWQIINYYKNIDNRIITYKQSNKGLTKTLIEAASKVKGSYLARFDADDISHITRFEEQIEWFKNNSKKVLCGTYANIINEEGVSTGAIKNLETKHEKICKRLLFRNDFIHSSIMFKIKPFIESGGYNFFFKYAQDYEAWCRLSFHGLVGNLPRQLISSRSHSFSVSKKNLEDQTAFAILAASIYNLQKNKNFKFKITSDSIFKEIESIEKIPQANSYTRILRFLYAKNLNENISLNFFDLSFSEILYSILLINFFLKRSLWGILGNKKYNILKRYLKS